MRKNTGFTLIEVLVAVALTGTILLTGYSTFQRILQAQARLGATIDIQKNLFYVNEKLATLIRSGGTLDYEEYFNRRNLGYDRAKVDTNGDGDTTDSSDAFTFSTSSHFGNEGDTPATKPQLYYCGIHTWTGEEHCLTDSHVGISTAGPNFNLPFPTGEQQAYGQYAALAYNYDAYNTATPSAPIGFPVPIQLPQIFLSAATVDMFQGPIVTQQKILDVGLPELYLIKENLDGSYERTYFRHVYVDDPFFTGTPKCDPAIPDVAGNEAANITGCLGKIQMTKLMDCDSLDATGTPTPNGDGIIDAWRPTPDFRVVAVDCPQNIASIYKSAHEDVVTGTAPNLTWVDVTSPDMNVVRAAFLPSPPKIPAFMSGAGDFTQAPQVSVYLEVSLSTRLRNQSFITSDKNYPRTLITTYDLSE